MLFRSMQTLPVKYFDTHTHGDVMSYYTNDADSLRMMLSQSLPQVIQSVLTLVFVSLSMMYQSLLLTAIVLVFSFFMLKLVGAVAGKRPGTQIPCLGQIHPDQISDRLFIFRN